MVMKDTIVFVTGIYFLLGTEYKMYKILTSVC